MDADVPVLREAVGEMVRLIVDGSELVVLPRRWERIATGVGAERLLLDDVDRVEVQAAPWRCLRGEREHGISIPDVVWLGTWRHPFGLDLVAVRPRRGPCLQVDFRPKGRFARIALTVPEPEALGEELAALLGPGITFQGRWVGSSGG
ncbi:hypothetical protein [Streptacidiphilus jiangxiensis]|uniref:Uncharacterized protein n=1 Tax=Streptacidiphilus jiangxiensis TaxID=235985 RepID=A0A1H7MZQ6_STRJI|nr:hypothetical protein [Streptacidiphilus jiangxiensis]SEL16792.1 hypothetical protein SAMN05414137_106150 [Streptacidiphilus jiangxiensis]